MTIDISQPLDPEAVVGPSVACKYLGISRTSLYRLTMDGTLPYYHLFGNRYRYKVADLTSWLESQRIERKPATVA